MKSTFPKSIYLSAAARTPIGKFGGTLKKFTASELAALCLKESIKRAKDITPDYVFLGQARQAGARPNPARQATIFSGLGENVPAITFNQACASGLTSVISAAEKIALGRAKNIYAGGVESMSNTPYFLMQGRWGLRMGNVEILDGMTQDGFFCPMANMLMGQTVEEFIAKERGITRMEQDEYALLSQQRADLAWKDGLYAAETFEMELKEDEHRRGQTTMETLAKLPPVFDKKGGTVTAGNSSGITDGAAFVLVSDEKSALTQAELLDFEMVALDPKHMGLGPIPATLKILSRNGLKIADIEAIELNEAFAVQVLACQRELSIPIEKLNPRGGAIAIGHPIGATGTRILVSLIHQLSKKSGALGLATLCVSGGQGVCVLIKAV